MPILNRSSIVRLSGGSGLGLKVFSGSVLLCVLYLLIAEEPQKKHIIFFLIKGNIRIIVFILLGFLSK